MLIRRCIFRGTPRLENVHCCDGGGAGDRARVEHKDGIAVDALGKLVVVLNGQQRGLVAIDAEVVHLGIGNHLGHRLEHAQPAA